MIAKKIIVTLCIYSIVAAGIAIPLVYNHNFNYQLANNLLRKADESIIINNMTILLEAFLWRDFMPGVEEGGTGIYAAITIIATNVSIFPDFLDSKRMWLVNFGDTEWNPEDTPPTEIWFTKLEDIGTEHNTLNKRASEGPKWDIGLQLHIIIEIEELKGDTLYLQLQCELEATY